MIPRKGGKPPRRDGVPNIAQRRIRGAHPAHLAEPTQESMTPASAVGWLPRATSQLHEQTHVSDQGPKHETVQTIQARTECVLACCLVATDGSPIVADTQRGRTMRCSRSP